jgi:outer membrane lipoprotein SlyB
VEIKGNASGLGAVAGGVTGAVVGNQIGRGNGNTAMTILGAAGGALAGNEIERNVKKRYSYRVKVRMDDGTFRAVSQIGAPAVEVGERVRIINGALVALS